MKRQLESIRNLAKAKIKLSHDANKRQKRIIPIKSSTKMVLNPHDQVWIPIHFHHALKNANYNFKPRSNKCEV